MRNLNLVEHEAIDNEVVTAVKSVFDERLARNQLTEHRLGDARIFYFEKLIPKELGNVFFEKHLSYCSANGIKKPRYMTLMVNKTWATPGGLGSGAGWHRDSGYELQHKTFTYLSDVEADNGPFVIRDKENYGLSLLNNTRTRIAEPLTFKFKFGRMIDETFTGTAGRCFSCCTNFIHRGMPVVAGERYMATVYAWNGKPPQIHLEYFNNND